MFDLHSHLLPGIDDGSSDYSMSLDMARAYLNQGVECVACTPHILPGLYHNTGTQIKEAVAALEVKLGEAEIALKLVAGADNHIVPDFIDALKRGHLLCLGDSVYVLVEPPHHVAPVRLEHLLFNIAAAGYIPILTHPERLSWIEHKYDVIRSLVSRGVWMQLTAGSLLGSFGSRPRFWAERMLGEGLVHILATDAHNMTSRPPNLLEGRNAAAKLIGETEARHLVATRPKAVLANIMPEDLPEPLSGPLKERQSSSGGTAFNGRAGRVRHMPG
jgi:protein-tyrosine phosphatase